MQELCGTSTLANPWPTEVMVTAQLGRSARDAARASIWSVLREDAEWRPSPDRDLGWVDREPPSSFMIATVGYSQADVDEGRIHGTIRG